MTHIRWYHHLWFIDYLIHSLRISFYENLLVWDCWIFDLEVYSKIFQHEHQMILISFFSFEIVIFDFDLDEPNVYHVSHLLNLKIITDYPRLYETIMVQMLRKLQIQRKYDIIYTWFVWSICFIGLCWMEWGCSMVPCGIAHIWLGWRLNGTGNRFAQHWIVKRH